MIRTAFILLSLSLLLSGVTFAQVADNPVARSSAAYAELLLRKTDVAAEIDALAADYTDTNPKMLDMRAELTALDKWLGKLLAVKAADSGKLTLALGKLIVRRCSLEAELARLIRSYDQEHQEVKRARKRLAVFNVALDDLLK